MKNLGKGIMLIMISLLIFSCSDGEDGAVGPAGLNGVDGTDGTDGETGTANVIYSDWIDSEFEEDITDGFDSFSISAPELTQELIESGTLLVYGRIDNGTVYQLPLVLYGFINESYFVRIIEPGAFSLGVEGVASNNIGAPFFNDVFRYIIIPGGLAAGKSTVDYQNMSYEEIVEHFNIK
ncbi:collagen-like protein [uncultured Aquimarina sp.]|uniref:collagen-like protein n=1 Tax=uncultured Aquimarina sp. TaxID=575652 RepID=UPI0026247D23|nr:collagen-like protein [uncultured Aquimarina sp.]